jgi:hypothetical protein
MSDRTPHLFLVVMGVLAYLLAPQLAAQGLPVAVAPETAFWLGRVPAFGPPVSHEFTLLNQGSAPLQILKAEKVCQCASFEIGAQTIQPGEETTLAVTVDPRGKRGEFGDGVRIETNDPETPSLTFLLRGEAFDRIQLEPELFDFGAIPPEALPAARISFQVEINDPDIEALGETVPSSAALTCQVTPLGNKRYEILVHLHPGLPDEFFEESLRFTFTGAKPEVITVPVRGFIQSRVEPSRRFLSLAEFLKRTPMSQTVYLTHATPFRITGIDSPEWLTVASAPLPDPDNKRRVSIQKLVIILDPAKLPAAQMPPTRLRIRADLPDSPQVFLLVFDDRTPPRP